MHISSSFSFCTVAQQHYYQISSVTFTDNKKIAYNYSDPGGTLEKLNKLKSLISRNEELYISKEVKDKMLLHQRVNHADQKQWPQKITEYACHDLSVWNKRQESHLISQNVFLQSIIYPSEKKKKKILEQAAFWHEVKVVCCLPTPFFTLRIPEGRDWKNAQGSRPLQVASSSLTVCTFSKRFCIKVACILWSVVSVE